MPRMAPPSTIKADSGVSVAIGLTSFLCGHRFGFYDGRGYVERGVSDSTAVGVVLISPHELSDTLAQTVHLTPDYMFTLSVRKAPGVERSVTAIQLRLLAVDTRYPGSQTAEELVADGAAESRDFINIHQFAPQLYG